MKTANGVARSQSTESFLRKLGDVPHLFPMESFWGSLKNELVNHQRYTIRDEAKASIQEYIEIFYNRQRRHSRLGYISPAAFEANYYKMKEAA